MNPFLILLVGMVVVIGGILAFRLHAFLALILAAMAVGLLTSADAVTWYARRQAAGEVVAPKRGEANAQDDSKVRFTVKTPSRKSLHVEPGTPMLVFRRDAAGDDKAHARLVVESTEKMTLGGKPETVAVATLADAAKFADIQPAAIQPGDRVIVPAAWAAAKKTAGQTAIERVADGFGGTAAKIGILIAMAAIIGKCLLESGAADRIIRTFLGWVGEARASIAFLFSGFSLGIPVFFDTVFYLMIPLGKALRMRTGHNYLLYILTITAGATMAHSLVPPTPGPLLVASELDVNIGVMILGGCFVGAFCSVFGYFYAVWINRRMEIPLRDSPDAPLAELEKMAACDESELPPFWLSMLPIALPVVLIAGGTVLDRDTSGIDLGDSLGGAITFLSNKNIALIVSAAIALLTLAWKKQASRDDLAAGVAAALASGGVIILITSAGGAFGGMLKQTGVGHAIAGLTPKAYPLLVLPVAFGVTTLVRTAQGSATVAMITAVGILAPLAMEMNLGQHYHIVYLALAIGCGSKPISWMNDSGFWVICKMSGMTEGETLKALTPMTASMGVVGLIVTMLCAWLVPLVGV